MNIKTLFTDASSGYLIEESEFDTRNIVCRHGHIYAEGKMLFASLDVNSPRLARQLRKLGEPVMDGDEGELTVRFEPSRFADVSRLLMPRQRVFAQTQVA